MTTEMLSEMSPILNKNEACARYFVFFYMPETVTEANSAQQFTNISTVV